MRIILLLLFVTGLLFPVFASAQPAGINLNLDYPVFGNIDLNCQDPQAQCGQNLNALIAWLYYFIVGIAGLAAFVMLVWGGIQWLTSGAIPSQASEARDKLRAAFLGLLLILASFLIIQIINPQLTLLQDPTLGDLSAPGSVPFFQGDTPDPGEIVSGGGAGPGTGGPPTQPGPGIPLTPQCSDGIDNDNDGTADYAGAAGLPADPDCNGQSQGASEGGVVPLPPGQPGIPSGTRLMLVVFNDSQKNFFLNNPSLVQGGDFFMLVRGNDNSGDSRIGRNETDQVNGWARDLKGAFPNTTMIAATAGRQDHMVMADNLDPGLIRGIMQIYEPKAVGSPGFPEFPHRAFASHNGDEVRRVTRNLINLLGPYTRSRGFELWFKPSGRSAFQPSSVDSGNPCNDPNAKPMIDYGEIGKLTDGQNIQLQGSIPDRQSCAINNVVKWYQDWGVDGSINGNPVFLQTSLSGSGGNAVPVSQAFNFIQEVWSKIPQVAGGTMWWASGQPGDARQFLQLR